MTRTIITKPGRHLTARLFDTPLFQMAHDLESRTRRRFDEVFGASGEDGAPWLPAVNVSETKEEFTLTAELPGISAKDVTVDYVDGMLTVRGEKKEERKEEDEGRMYYLWERRAGAFQRTLPFPGGVLKDKITAEFKEGVLTVHLPKTEDAKEKRQAIPVVAR